MCFWYDFIFYCYLVGNIPIGVSADDMENMLSRAGTVVNFTYKYQLTVII